MFSEFILILPVLFSVKDDLNRVNEELDESHGLVRSLKSELALYEKYYKNKGMPGKLFSGGVARKIESCCSFVVIIMFYLQ